MQGEVAVSQSKYLYSRGFTLIETIVVMAVISILAGIGFTFMGAGSSPRLMANDYRAMIQQARFEAIKRNLPVAVVRTGQEYRTLVKDDAAINCNTANSTQINIKRASEYRNVQISSATGTANGIVWLPNGMARACDGSGVVTGTATFSSGSSTASVIISQGGRVRAQ
jgi:prepilin-type N-terminal cleavage/methylation domain-containing protein